ncbi:hypothetical protein [Methylobacterium sp. JK268]
MTKAKVTATFALASEIQRCLAPPNDVLIPRCTRASLSLPVPASRCERQLPIGHLIRPEFDKGTKQVNSALKSFQKLGLKIVKYAKNGRLYFY